MQSCSFLSWEQKDLCEADWPLAVRLHAKAILPYPRSRMTLHGGNSIKPAPQFLEAERPSRYTCSLINSFFCSFALNKGFVKINWINRYVGLYIQFKLSFKFLFFSELELENLLSVKYRFLTKNVFRIILFSSTAAWLHCERNPLLTVSIE